jgi:hypothetical protein
MPDHVVLHLSDLYFHSDEHEHHNNRRELLKTLSSRSKILNQIGNPLFS